MSVDSTLKKAAKLAQKGDRAAAAALYREVLARFPQNPRARQGLAALGPGASAPPPAELARLTAAMQAGQAALVARDGARLAQSFPEAPALINLVAMALAATGQLEASLGWYDRLIAADPRFAGAHVNKASALARLGRFGEVETHARAALKLNANIAPAHLMLGYALVNTGRAEAALAPFEEAVRLAPKEPTTHLGLGNALAALSRPGQAKEHFEAALALDPNNPDALNNLGNAQGALGHGFESIDTFAAAIARHPRHAVLRLNHAQALADAGQTAEAIAAAQELIALDPDNVQAWTLIGYCQNAFGDREAARAALERACALDPDSVAAATQLWRVTGITPDDPDFPRLQGFADRDSLDSSERTLVELQLFSAFDKAGEAERAFPHLARAKATRAAAEPYAMDDQRAMFDALKAAFTPPPEPLGAAEIAADPAPARPLFIAGMPRSGTTLVEQILSSHSQVHGGGELTGIDFALKGLGWGSGRVGRAPSRDDLVAIRQSYLAGLARIGTDRPVITDKTPLNFRYIGFILAAFPEARVLVMRRDARAVCWSNFSHSFIGRANSFGLTQENVAAYYRLHLDLVAFWQALWPDRITLVPYERLTEHQEEESRKLVAAAGLDWEPACLDFHRTDRAVRTASQTQVRRKMYTGSSEAWRAYEAHLGPMLAGLDGL